MKHHTRAFFFPLSFQRYDLVILIVLVIHTHTHTRRKRSSTTSARAAMNDSAAFYARRALP